MAFRATISQWHRGAPQQPADCIETGDHLRRISLSHPPVSHVIDNRSWDDALTGLRGLAASWVLLFHLFGVVGPRALFVPGTSIRLHWLLTSGGAGVWVLYTLCGYLLAGPFVTRENSRQVPHIRRYLRPSAVAHSSTLWVQILVLSIVAGWADGQMLIRLSLMLPYALLVQNLVLPLSRSLLPTQCGGHCQSSSTSTCCCHCFLQSSARHLARRPVWHRCGYC